MTQLDWRHLNVPSSGCGSTVQHQGCWVDASRADGQTVCGYQYRRVRGGFAGLLPEPNREPDVQELSSVWRGMSIYYSVHWRKNLNTELQHQRTIKYTTHVLFLPGWSHSIGSSARVDLDKNLLAIMYNLIRHGRNFGLNYFRTSFCTKLCEAGILPAVLAENKMHSVFLINNNLAWGQKPCFCVISEF